MKVFVAKPLLLSLALGGCVSAPKSTTEPSASLTASTPSPGNCLDKKSVKAILDRLSGVVDKMSSEKSGDTTSVQDGCYKKVFRRKDYKIIVYKDPKSMEQSASSATKQISESEIYTPECLAKAEQDIAKLNLKFADEVLKRGRSEIAWRWNDMDMGSVFWLRCGGADRAEYNDSLATLVHETVHGLRRDDCIFSPFAADRLCLSLPSELPPRSIAAYKTFDFKNPAEVEGYKYLQGIYMEAMDEGPLLLFDELNAYTTTAGSFTGLLQHGGKAALFDADGKRGAVFVTAFMAYTVRYLNLVRGQHAALYEKNFSAGSKNRAHILRLLGDAEKTYAQWTEALAKVGGKPKESEEWFLAEYKRGRAQLGW